MTKSIARTTDAQPWASKEAAKEALLATSDGRRLHRRPEFLFFGSGGMPPHAMRDKLSKLGGVLTKLDAPIAAALRQLRTMPFRNSVAFRATLDLVQLEDLLRQVQGFVEAVPRVASRMPRRLERAQRAANVLVESMNLNGLPEPTPEELALLAVAGGLEEPCSDEQWPDRIATWRLRLRRARTALHRRVAAQVT